MNYPYLSRNKEPKNTEIWAMLIILLIVLIAFFIAMFFMPNKAHAEEVTQTSWYSVASCKREGTWQKYGGLMANGEVFADEKMVCASWDYPFGTLLKVVNLANKKSVVVKVADRGPSKKLCKRGRKLDLSKGAFAKVADLKQGVVQVTIEQIKKGRR